MVKIATRKVGGIRFVKIGRYTFSACASAEFRPFPAKAAPAADIAPARLDHVPQVLVSGLALAYAIGAAIHAYAHTVPAVVQVAARFPY